MSWGFLYSKVTVHYVEDIHKLALVLVNSLHLDIVKRIERDIDASVLHNPVLELLLILALDLLEATHKVRVLSMVIELSKCLHVIDPLVCAANSVADQLGKAWIAAVEPASWCHAICFVLNLAWVKLVELREDCSLEKLCV